MSITLGYLQKYNYSRPKVKSKVNSV